jgi:hypothetical protein
MTTHRALPSTILAVALLLLSAIAVADRHTMLRMNPVLRTSHAEPAAQGGTNWVLEGCWSQFSGGPCYDIYRDASGNDWKCSRCGTTKKANPNTCSPISLETLNRGFWCS